MSDSNFSAEIKIAQSLIAGINKSRDVNYEFPESLLNIDKANSNFIINLLKVEGFAYIAYINKNWYKVRKLKNDWKSNPQVIEKIDFLEQDNSIKDEAIKIILDDFLEHTEGIDDLIAINTMLDPISDFEIIKTSNGKVLITKSVFGIIYGDPNDKNFTYKIVAYEDYLILLYEVETIILNLPHFKSDEDKVRYEQYQNAKIFYFDIHNKYKN